MRIGPTPNRHGRDNKPGHDGETSLAMTVKCGECLELNQGGVCRSSHAAMFVTVSL
jgi:hypothetical protein